MTKLHKLNTIKLKSNPLVKNPLKNAKKIKKSDKKSAPSAENEVNSPVSSPKKKFIETDSISLEKVSSKVQKPKSFEKKNSNNISKKNKKAIKTNLPSKGISVGSLLKVKHNVKGSKKFKDSQAPKEEDAEGDEAINSSSDEDTEKVPQYEVRQEVPLGEKLPKITDLDASEPLPESNFDMNEFDEIFTSEKLIKLVEVLNSKVATECINKKQRIFDDFNYLLDVVCFKIPSCPKRTVKLKIKHPLVRENDDVVLIVKDLMRGARVDYEPTIEHYKELLKTNGVTSIKKIIPFNQLKNEYKNYEMKIKLSNTYDVFLCDGTIVGAVVGFLGQKFSKSRCTPYSVRMGQKNILSEINKALHKTCYRQGQKGPMISIAVGIDKHTSQQVMENILLVVNQLKTVYPGGLANIRNMYLKTTIVATPAVPCYISLGLPPSETPYVAGIREIKMKKLKSKADEILSKFNITEDARVGLKRKLDPTADVAADDLEHEEDETIVSTAVKRDKKDIENFDKKSKQGKKNALKKANKEIKNAATDDIVTPEVKEEAIVKKEEISKENPSKKIKNEKAKKIVTSTENGKTKDLKKKVTANIKKVADEKFVLKQKKNFSKKAKKQQN